jgi:DNA-binding FadR family transcriptional regulator
MEPIQRKSLAQEVADTLKHRIKSGVLAIDSKLPTEPELMEKFGVGRSTIREAIKNLAQSGFVHVQQGLGTFVVSLTGHAALDEKIGNADFAEVFEVRQILELQIIEKACHHRTAKNLKQMQKDLKERFKQAQTGNLQACITADIAFHTQIAESCGNHILAELYKTLSIHVTRFFSQTYTDTSPFIQSQQIHEELLQHLDARNPDKALQAAKKIIGTL